MPATIFQYATPIAIIGSTSWTGSVADVDEPPPFNDADIMQSPNNSTISSLSFSIEYQLSTSIDPNYYSDGFAVLIQAAKGNGALVQTLTFSLKQGSTVILSSTFTLSVSATLQSYVLSSGEIAAITDYTNLSLLLTAQPPTGGAGNNNVILSGCALQIPAVGFDHLILNSTGFKIVGPHYGLWLTKGNTGYVENVGSETVGALIDLNTEHN